MDGKMRQSRRSRSQRDQVRRRESASTDARNQSPSSGSERDESPGREHASQNVKKTQNVSASVRAPRPPRRKRRESGSQEEVIIDGFAISSFITLEFLEKDLALKPQERLLVKKRRGQENGVTAEPAQNGHLDGYRSSEREQDRGKKKVPLKKSKQMKGCLTQTSKNSEEDPLQELTGPHLSESSTHCFSGHGYSCDSESDVDDKASDVGSEKLFSPTLSKGLNSNENLESKTSSSTKVSGLQRSQEQSTEVPFVPPAPSPIPASPPAASSLPAAAAASTAAPPPSTRVRSPPPPVKKAAAVRLPTPSPLPAQSQPQTELRAPPPQVHAPPIFNHQVHHQLQHYNSLNNISRSSSASSAASASLPKHHLPPSPHFAGHPSSNPALPLSIASLATSHYSLRPPPHHHPAMFATPATLPPPPTLPTNSLVVPGHPSGAGFPDTSLLISFNQPIMYCQPHSGILIGTLSQATLLPPPMSPHAENPHSMSWRNRECQFDKYAPKLDNPFLRHSSFYPSYPQTMSGMPPLLPHTGPFSSPHGAFQPSKASNPLDVAGRPGGVPHTLLQKDPRVSDPYRTPVRKPGKWCAVHVQIAWQIYHHQQKMKQMQVEPHKLDMNGKLDLFSRPPAPGVFPGFPYPHDLARPLFSSTGTGHPAAASPYGHSPHHSSFLPTGHLADPFSRSSSFGSLGSLGTSAFGGLGNPSIAPSSVFGHKEGHGLPGFSSPHHDTWNRLHRAPPSFPTPPQWPKAADVERSSSVTNHDRERDREPEKRDSSIGREERDKDRSVYMTDAGMHRRESPLYQYNRRDSLDKNRHSNRSSPASAPGSYKISSLIRSNSQTSSDSSRKHSGSTERSREPERELLERQRESALTGDIKVKESRSPGKEMPIQEMTKPAHQPPSPYGKPILTDAGLKLKDGERKAGEPPSAELLHKVKNDVKIKEERKEDQEVMVVSMEPPPSQPPPQQQQHPHHQPPRCTEMPSPASLHGVPLPHSMPLSMSGVHQVNSLSALDRARMAPFMGINPLVPGRDRVPPPGFTWDPLRDPLREAYRNLDLQRRMDFQLRAEQSHRFPAMFEPERGYRDREPHEYSHHEHLLEARAREHERLRQAEERERMHLCEELDRARLHQLHQSPIEGHLPHMPPFMSPLGGMHYHRLSPSAAHNGMLNRTPPTAALSAPPPLVSAGIPRPASPRRTTPLTASEPRDYSPSRKPKEVEAR